MKTILTIILALFGIFGYSQAHLYSSRADIVDFYPNHEMVEIASDDGGLPYLVIEHDYGNFIYFFNELDYCTVCFQVPHTQLDLNMQVKEYNHKYVALNDHQWRAYVGEGVLLITLEYDTGFKSMVFTYYNSNE